MGGDGREAAERLAAFLDDWPHGDVMFYATADEIAPLTTADLRAVLARSAELEAENARMREELEALIEAQPSLQGSAFRIGWQTCRDKVNRATELLRGELAALDYAEEVRKLNAEPLPDPEPGDDWIPFSERLKRDGQQLAGDGEPGCGRVCSEMHTYEPGQCEAAPDGSQS